jgi:hypothetical protein
MAAYFVPAHVDQHQADSYTVIGFVAPSDSPTAPLRVIFANGQVCESVHRTVDGLRVAGRLSYLERSRPATEQEIVKLAPVVARALVKGKGN